jgi:hypothetical protein
MSEGFGLATAALCGGKQVNIATRNTITSRLDGQAGANAGTQNSKCATSDEAFRHALGQTNFFRHCFNERRKTLKRKRLCCFVWLVAVCAIRFGFRNRLGDFRFLNELVPKNCSVNVLGTRSCLRPSIQIFEPRRNNSFGHRHGQMRAQIS